MRYKDTPFDKPLQECPDSCGECQGYQPQSGSCCANTIRTPTLAISDPKDRPIPYPLHCYWWYANEALRKLPPTRREEIREERYHLFVYRYLDMNIKSKDEKMELIQHLCRPGGGRRIDFSVYPQAKEIYDMLKAQY